MKGLAVFKIKVFICAPLGRTGPQTVRLGGSQFTPQCIYIVTDLKKRAPIRLTVPKIVRPTAELYAPGAVCTVNFEH